MISGTHFCFDFDGTITAEELLPVMARGLGLDEEIAELTRLTIEGEIPFADSFSRRVKILGEFGIEEIHRSLENVRYFERILSFILERPDKCSIVTGNLDVWIAPLVSDWGVAVYASEGKVLEQEKGGATMLIKALDKGDALEEIRISHSGKIVAVGDGFGDIPMLAKADIGIAFGGLHRPIPDLVKVASHVILEEAPLCRFLELQ